MEPTKTEKENLLSYLDEVLSFESAKLVGRSLKRIEILSDAENLKKEIRELIYESFRDIKDIFIAYGRGLEKSYFVIKQSKEQL
jgi:hypothetical protein